MIKGIILDIDGVIVGEKIGYNSPYPHPDVIAKLKEIEAGGVPISLCTAKPHYAIRKIINDANLRNLHITDGGAVIIDPIDDIVLEAHTINPDVAKSVVTTYLQAGVYVEVYTVDEYALDASQQSELTETHTHILQQKPRISTSLLDELDNLKVCKIMPVSRDESDKSRLAELFKPYDDELTLSWGVHPIALPHQFGIITAKGISKRQAVLKIAEHSEIHPSHLLGIGDSTSDWQFIQDCGYAATVENGAPELKELIATKTRNFVGGSVDGSGVLDIFAYWGV